MQGDLQCLGAVCSHIAVLPGLCSSFSCNLQVSPSRAREVCDAMRCDAEYCTVLHCPVLRCTALHCIHCTALYCTECTALYCTVLLLLDRLARIQEEAGIRAPTGAAAASSGKPGKGPGSIKLAGLLDELLEGEFDPEEYDRRMAQAFDDEYYEVCTFPIAESRAEECVWRQTHWARVCCCAWFGCARHTGLLAFGDSYVVLTGVVPCAVAEVLCDCLTLPAWIVRESAARVFHVPAGNRMCQVKSKHSF